MTEIIDWLLFSFCWMLVFDDGCLTIFSVKFPKKTGEVIIPIFKNIALLSFQGARIAQSVARLASDQLDTSFRQTL